MAVLIKRKKIVQTSELEEITVDAPTVADAIRILKSTKEEDIENIFKYRVSKIGEPEVKASFIDIDNCEIINNI